MFLQVQFELRTLDMDLESNDTVLGKGAKIETVSM